MLRLALAYVPDQSAAEGAVGDTAGEMLDRARQAIAGLPPAQRAVITLRDVQGWPAAEVCSALGISEGNQRVLLHRARAKARRALEQYFDEG